MAAVVADLPRSHALAAGRHRPRLLRGAAVTGVAVLALVGFGRVADLWPTLTNPFGTDTVNRTGPAVLAALSDLHRYQAASGSFSVLVDVERDARFLPAFVKGDRTLYVAAGTVDAGVDFSDLGDGAVRVDGDSATVVLPRARITEPRIDPEASYVASRDRGLLDRVGSVFSDSPTSERGLQIEATDRLSAAAAESGLLAKAEANTTAMLEDLLGGLGFREVDVRFEAARPQ